MDFEKVYEYGTSVANVAFANLEQKEQIRDSLLIFITNTCLAYESDANFRVAVKNYRKYLASQK